MGNRRFFSGKKKIGIVQEEGRRGWKTKAQAFGTVINPRFALKNGKKPKVQWRKGNPGKAVGGKKK